MYKLMQYFSTYSDNGIRVSKQLPNNFEYLNSRLFYNINEITTYYNLSNFTVKRPNPFISLLNDASLVITDDIFETYENIIDNYIYFANDYHITTTKSLGKPLKNVIFDNVDEFFLLEEASNVNIVDFKDKWRNYESIKVISTDNTEILLEHPYTTTLNFTSFIIYKVDIIALVLQYYYWIKEQTSKQADTDIALFVHQIAFNNVLTSFNTISLSNLFLTYESKSDVYVKYSNIVSSIVNIDNALNKVAKNWKTIFKSNRYKSYYDFTKKFYPFKESLYEINKIISIVDNENEWLYLLAILNELNYYIGYIKKDKEFINDLKITIKTFDRKNIRLNDISKFYLFNLISSIKEKIGK